jgi:chorismate mutase
MALTERQERLAREREEIAARVASFKATQEKFQREREEFVRRTWRDVGQEQQPRSALLSRIFGRMVNRGN